MPTCHLLVCLEALAEQLCRLLDALPDGDPRAPLEQLQVLQERYRAVTAEMRRLGLDHNPAVLAQVAQLNRQVEVHLARLARQAVQGEGQERDGRGSR